MSKRVNADSGMRQHWAYIAEGSLMCVRRVNIPKHIRIEQWLNSTGGKEFTLQHTVLAAQLFEFTLQLSEFTLQLSEFTLQFSEFTLQLFEFTLQSQEFRLELSKKVRCNYLDLRIHQWRVYAKKSGVDTVPKQSNAKYIQSKFNYVPD